MSKELTEQLDRLFEPRSIAIIGASNVKMKWGYIVPANILAGGWKGDLYPVNPKETEILERPAFKSVKDIPGEVDLALITIPSMRNGVPSIRERVQTVVTPGETVDVIVTERGIAVNPRREDLRARLRDAGLPVKDIRRLKAEIEHITGIPDEVAFADEIVGIVEYRDGTIIDAIRKIKG